MWNVIGWCTIGSPQGGMAKCPEPSLVTRLADKGRTWGIGPILFAHRMVQSPSGPCKEKLGFLFFFWCYFFSFFSKWLGPSLSDLITGLFFLTRLTPLGSTRFTFKEVGWTHIIGVCSPAEHAKNSYAVWSISRTEDHKGQGRRDAQNEREGRRVVGKMYFKGAWLFLTFQSKLIYFQSIYFILSLSIYLSLYLYLCLSLVVFSN